MLRRRRQTSSRRGRVCRWGGVSVCLAWLWLASGCKPVGVGQGGGGGGGGVSGEGVYGALAVTSAVVEVGPARVATGAAGPTNAALTVVQTELHPATLWRSAESRVRVFADMGSTGLGGPTFVSYSSPTGITRLRPGEWLDGGQMRENWLLAGFAGASGWTNWDSPWGVFLERRPKRVMFGTNGVELQFIGAARHFAMMPLYGYYKPPQEGREVVGVGAGAEDEAAAKRRKAVRTSAPRPKLQTWEWPLAVARDPLTRLRYWAGATRLFPVRCEEGVRVDRGRDAVTFRHRFEWLEIPDEWGTRPIRVSPVSPTLGLAWATGRAVPMEFSRAPFDFEIPTPYGPYHGIPEADGFEVTFRVLQYVNETEAPVAVAVGPAGAGAGVTPVVREALERLEAVASRRFAAGDRFEPDHGGMENFCWSILGDQWYAKAMPYYSASTRSNAVAVLGRYFREVVLVPERYQEREYPKGSGRRYLILEGPGIGSWGELGDAGKIGASLLQTVWAYAHFSGDRALVVERWPLIRRLFTTAAQTRWVGWGRDEMAELGDEAAPALAYARLAYMAGDLEAYHFGCSIFARELVHLAVKQTGADWFREQQPWHSMERMEGEVFLTNLWGDLAGWQLDGPRYPAETGERQSGNRWVRFQDLDVARFYRERLGKEVRAELEGLRGVWDPKHRFTDDSHIRPSWVRLESMLLQPEVTGWAGSVDPKRFEGPPSGVIASCVAVVRLAQAPRFERLIPGAAPSGFVRGLDREVPGPNPHLVQGIEVGEGAEAGWPRITWWGWKTPTGRRWNFGEVRAGDDLEGQPRVVRREAVNWNSVRYEFREVKPGDAR